MSVSETATDARGVQFARSDQIDVEPATELNDPGSSAYECTGLRNVDTEIAARGHFSTRDCGSQVKPDKRRVVPSAV